MDLGAGVVSGRQLVSTTVDTFRHRRKQSVDFAGVFDNRGDGIAVVDTTATSQRARVALFNVLAPSNAARGIFPGSPLAPPNAKADI